jgi:hypothetical protein
VVEENVQLVARLVRAVRDKDHAQEQLAQVGLELTSD